MDIYTTMQRPQQFRDPLLDTSGKIIGFYPREFFVFDNFASFQVDWKGRRWATSEHAYQASHFVDTAPLLVEAIYGARSAHEAYKIAKANGARVPSDWESRKLDVMYDICKCKLLQNEYVWLKLALSGELPIVEDSPKDDYWGWGAARDGRNELGKIWMTLREELRAGKLNELRSASWTLHSQEGSEDLGE